MTHAPEAIRQAAPSRYHQVVFVWMKDAATFGHYVELLRPVVAPYGGALERMLVPETVYGEGLTRPDIVNSVFYDSAEAFAAFEADATFQEIVPLRSAAIDMAAIGGLSVAGDVTDDDLANRLYLVEIAKFGPRGAAGYASFEAEAQPMLARHGYHVERVIAPDAVSGFPFTPDLVKIAYFDRLDGLERLHVDPDHGHINDTLYPAAVQEAIWVTTRVHPVTYMNAYHPHSSTFFAAIS